MHNTMPQVRKNPTGWTGMYAQLLAMVPPLHPEVKEAEEERGGDEL